MTASELAQIAIDSSSCESNELGRICNSRVVLLGHVLSAGKNDKLRLHLSEESKNGIAELISLFPRVLRFNLVSFNAGHVSKAITTVFTGLG